jgi:uncharacterized protein YkwD
LAGLVFIFAGLGLAQDLSFLESGILAEVNQLRANPSAYARLVAKWRIPDETSPSDEKPVHVLDEAVAEMKSIRRNLGSLVLSPGLSRAAADHVRDTGRRGLTSHRGTDGSDFERRIQRYGVWTGSSAENIVYGLDVAREAVIGQLVDYGVEGRGHRRNLLDPAWRYVGIACGAHTKYGTMCVMDFAADYREFRASN